MRFPNVKLKTKEDFYSKGIILSKKTSQFTPKFSFFHFLIKSICSELVGLKRTNLKLCKCLIFFIILTTNLLKIIFTENNQLVLMVSAARRNRFESAGQEQMINMFSFLFF